MKKSDNSFSFVSLSALVHAGVLAGLALIPALKMLPQGNDSVEIVTEASSPAPSAPIAMAVPTLQSPVVEKAVEQPIIAPVVAAPKVESKVEPKKVAKKIGPVKKVISTSFDEKATPSVEPTSDIAKAQEEAEAFAKEQASEMKALPEKSEAQPMDPDQEVLSAAAETAAAEAVAKQPEETPQPLPAPQTKPAVTKLSEIQESPVAAASEPTEAPGSNDLGATAGPSQDELRSYLDLKQMGNNRPPLYPVQARRNSWQGEVVLNYFVTQQGLVKDVKIARSSGYQDLDQEAVRAISQYKYVAGQEGWTSHPVMFALKGPATAAPSRLRSAGQGAKRDGQ